MFNTQEELTTAIQSAMPKVTHNKNGYEIRTKVLEMAQNNVWSDYHAKWGQFETTTTKDAETNEVVTTVAIPQVPGTEAILRAAEQFYAFVGGSVPKK